VVELEPRFHGPIGKIRLGYKVAETLGWRWVLTRIYLDAEHRSGVLKRRTPPSTWADYVLEGSPTYRTGGLHPEAAAPIIATQPEEVRLLRNHAEMLKDRQFDIFSKRTLIEDWHHDPIENVSYPPDVHWSKVKEYPQADLKLVWEPSRFYWVYDLARLHAVDPSSPAADLFWLLFEDWCEANQPHLGVQWKCGQEAAIRFMAVCFATQSFAAEGLDDDRRLLLAKFADVTAKRIAAHWRYAQSQDNNHIVSEAVGLIGYGLLFPDLAYASGALALGERLLKRACERLVFEDGGTSQYSSNYHRVFVDNFIWAVWLYRFAGQAAPVELTSALKRSADFLFAITNPFGGDMASYGNNDGAHLLPLATRAFRDVRSTLMMASKAVGSSCLTPDEIADEGALWLWGSADVADSVVPDPKPGDPVRVQTYWAGGVTIITDGRRRAVIRGGESRFRPPQCDLGHTEVWIDGIKALSDTRILTYKRLPGEPDYSLTRHHNGPQPRGREQMTRLGRFLWGDWPAS
jgi:hypothetical protein